MKKRPPRILAADLIEGVRRILGPHYRKNFSQYKKDFGAQIGSTKWSKEGQKLVVKEYPSVVPEFRFHTKCDSAFDLYAPDCDLVFELAMFQGNAVYEFHKVLFKMLIAGPTFSNLVFCIPFKPAIGQLRRPFNYLSFDVFERIHHLSIKWMVLDMEEGAWVGPLSGLLSLEE